jgi:hypothetical protein
MESTDSLIYQAAKEVPLLPAETLAVFMKFTARTLSFQRIMIKTLVKWDYISTKRTLHARVIVEPSKKTEICSVNRMIPSKVGL